MKSKKKTSDAKKKILAERKKKLTVRKKSLKKLEDRLKIVDRELSLIEKELMSSEGTRSKIVEEDLKMLEGRLLHMDFEKAAAPEKGESHRKAYRNFVFKCKKCLNEFDKMIDVPPVKKKVVCPACGRDHTLGVYPSSRFYHVYPSEYIEIRKPKK
jgi:rRNA maturation endonuclease Nob1